MESLLRFEINYSIWDCWSRMYLKSQPLSLMAGPVVDCWWWQSCFCGNACLYCLSFICSTAILVKAACTSCFLHPARQVHGGQSGSCGNLFLSMKLDSSWMHVAGHWCAHFPQVFKSGMSTPTLLLQVLVHVDGSWIFSTMCWTIMQNALTLMRIIYKVV